jgi:hypothetical protein
MRHISKKDGGHAMAFEIKRGDCGHGDICLPASWLEIAVPVRRGLEPLAGP